MGKEFIKFYAVENENRFNRVLSILSASKIKKTLHRCVSYRHQKVLVIHCDHVFLIKIENYWQDAIKCEAQLKVL